MARKQNIVIDQGSTFSLDIDLNDENGEPFDLTNYSAECEIKKHYLSANAISLTVTLETGNINISLTSNASSTIEAGKYVYDVKIIAANNEITRVIEGLATVTPSVTNNSTLVYNSTINKYEIKELNIDGGEF